MRNLKQTRREKTKRGKENVVRNKRPREQRLVTLKRLKRGDENELERKLRLEKVVASKQLRLAMETDEERKARLEMVATKRLRLAMEMDEESKARLEKMVATIQLWLVLETVEERRAGLEHLSDNQHLRLSAEQMTRESSKTGTSNLLTYVQNKEWACSPCNGNHYSCVCLQISMGNLYKKFVC